MNQRIETIGVRRSFASGATLAWVLVLATAVACVSAPRDAAAGTVCTTDADCTDPSAPKCIMGMCQAVPFVCSSDTDCLNPLLPICDQTTGACVAVSTPTATPTAASTLVPEGGSCVMSSECETGFCDNGTCEAVAATAPAISPFGLTLAVLTLLWIAWRIVGRRQTTLL